jgi:hypothetical protein
MSSQTKDDFVRAGELLTAEKVSTGTAKFATKCDLCYHSEHKLSVGSMWTHVPLRCSPASAKTGGGHLMLMEDFFNAVDRAFTRAANKVSSPFLLELKTSLKLPLLAPESPQATHSSDRRRIPERRLKERRRPWS